MTILIITACVKTIGVQGKVKTIIDNKKMKRIAKMKMCLVNQYLKIRLKILKIKTLY